MLAIKSVADGSPKSEKVIGTVGLGLLAGEKQCSSKFNVLT